MTCGSMTCGSMTRRNLLACGEQGNTLIELALVLPVFFTVLLGFIYFAMLMFQICNVTYASRVAMRYACLHSVATTQPTSTQDITGIVAPMIFLYPPNTSTTALTYSSGNVIGSTASVTVTLSFQMGIHFSTAASGAITQ